MDNIKIKLIPELKILVIGERGVDEFVYGDCERLAPDGPWPVFKPVGTKTNPGLAANCYENLRAFIGSGAHMFKGGETKLSPQKTRYIDKKTNHCFLRVDENDTVARLRFDDLKEAYHADSDNSIFDGIIISDYCKGYLIEEGIQHIMSYFKSINDKAIIFLDTKKPLGDWSKKIDIVKINAKEYADSHAKNNFPEGYCQNLVVTMGEDGTWLPQNGQVIPTEKIELKDSTGCGDVYMAAFAIKYCLTRNLYESAKYANMAATYKASIPGIHYFSLEELQKKFRFAQL